MYFGLPDSKSLFHLPALAPAGQSNHSYSSGAQSGAHVPEPGIPQIPGPQVPPRLGDPRQDRVLSVSGKKKCSHCKEELGKKIILTHHLDALQLALIASQLDTDCNTNYQQLQDAELP